MFFFGTFRNVQVKLAVAAECIEFVAFDFDVIWAGGCVDFLNIHDSWIKHVGIRKSSYSNCDMYAYYINLLEKWQQKGLLQVVTYTVCKV